MSDNNGEVELDDALDKFNSKDDTIDEFWAAGDDDLDEWWTDLAEQLVGEKQENKAELLQRLIEEIAECPDLSRARDITGSTDKAYVR